MITRVAWSRAVLTALAFLGGCVGPREVQRPGNPASAAIVIEHVTILPMTRDGDRIDDGTVVLRGARIAALGPASEIDMPQHARRIDGRGRFLMPALADMHVHIENEAIFRRMGAQGKAPAATFDTQDVLLPYVANGVLQVFNLSSGPEAMAQRDAVDAGRILGPHIALAVMVDGDPPINPDMARVAASPEDGRRLAAEIDAAGYDAVKTYTNLSFESFSAIVAAARERGLKVVGHLPLRQADRTQELLQPGFGMVAHAEEFAYQSPAVTESDIPRFADLVRRSDVWQVTTLKLNERVVEMTRQSAGTAERPEMRYVHPLTRQQWQANNRYAQTASLLPRREAVVRFNPVLLRAFVKAGVPIVVGTDTLVAGVIPGFGLHDELEALANAGLPNSLILEAATRLPAQWLGVSDDRGSIAVGRRADLLLLDADPLADVANTRRIAAVIASGRVLMRQELDEKMQALAARYATLPALASAPEATAFYGHIDE